MASLQGLDSELHGRSWGAEGKTGKMKTLEKLPHRSREKSNPNKVYVALAEGINCLYLASYTCMARDPQNQLINENPEM